MGIWIFMLSAALSILIALLTVGYQSVKAALTNPPTPSAMNNILTDHNDSTNRVGYHCPPQSICLLGQVAEVEAHHHWPNHHSNQTCQFTIMN
jgi:hypothetical protein